MRATKPISDARRRYFHGGIYGGAGPRRRGAPSQLALYQQVIEGTGAAANTILTFGMGFAEGDLQTSDTLSYRNTSDSAVYRTVVTPKSLWGDGSVSHALIEVELPSIGNGSTITCEAVRGLAHGSLGSNLSWATLASGKSVSVTVGSWTYDLLANVSSTDWRAGPLAIERRCEVAVPDTETGGITSARVVADITLTKDGLIQVSFTLRNDLVFQEDGGALDNISASLSINGTSVWSVTNHDRTLYAWSNRRLYYRNGASAATAMPIPKWNGSVGLYLVNGRQVGPYDPVNGVHSSVISTITAAADSGTWDNEDDARDMPTTSLAGGTGGAPQLMLDCNSVHCALANSDKRIIKYLLGQAEAAGLCPAHLWDPTGGDYTGGSGSGGWFDRLKWLNCSLEQAANATAPFVPGTTTRLPSGQGFSASTVWANLVPSHMGEFCSFPYLITGRRQFLDHLTAIAHTLVGRSNDTGTVNFDTGNGVNIRTSEVPFCQLRAWGYSVRQLGRAYWRAPTGAMKTYLFNCARAQHNVIGGNAATWASQRGEVAGWFEMVGPASNEYAMWQSAIFLFSALENYKWGVTDAQHTISYVGGLHVGIANQPTPTRYMLGGNGLVVTSSNKSTPADFATTYSALVALNPDKDDDWINYGYDIQSQLCAFAHMMSHAGATYGQSDVRAADAWGTISIIQDRSGFNSGTFIYLDPETLSRSPHLSVTPLGVTRADVAPNIPAQTLTVLEDAGTDDPVGVIRYTGGYLQTLTITGGTGNGKFYISNNGGGVRVGASAGNPPTGGISVGSYTLTLACTNRYGTAGTTNTITIDVDAVPVVAPVFSGGPYNFGIENTASVGDLVGEIDLTGSPASYSDTGDTEDIFTYTRNGDVLEVRVGPNGVTGIEDTFNVNVEATNGAGTDDQDFTVDVADEIIAPVVTASQVFDIDEGATTGRATDPTTVATTGGVPTSFSFTSGNTGSRFAVANDGDITNATAIYQDQLAQVTPTVQATNAGGSDSDTITINIAKRQHVAGSPDSYIGAAYSFSRRIITGYDGPLFRARRVSDGDEYDAVMSSGVLDESALASWLGSNEFEVITWYDQAAREMHVTAPASDKRPDGTSAAATLYKPAYLNSKFAPLFSSGRRLEKSSFVMPNDRTNWGMLMAFGFTSITNWGKWFSLTQESAPTTFDSETTRMELTSNTGWNWGFRNRGAGNPAVSPASTTGYIMQAISIDNDANYNVRLRINATLGSNNSDDIVPSSFNSSMRLALGAWPNEADAISTHIAECVILSTIDMDDVDDIRANMGTYYSISV